MVARRYFGTAFRIAKSGSTSLNATALALRGSRAEHENVPSCHFAMGYDRPDGRDIMKILIAVFALVLAMAGSVQANDICCAKNMPCCNSGLDCCDHG
jgi:hypothetical protein